MSSTVSTRLDPDDLALLESLSEMSGFDRASLIRSLLRRGMREMRLELASDLVRQSKVTLSRAVELSGLDVWDFVALMEQRNLELHYDTEEFAADLDAVSQGK